MTQDKSSNETPKVMASTNRRGWIGFDLDGTLAEYTHWQGPDHIGKPIEPTINLLKNYVNAGWEVRIFTARVYTDGSAERNAEYIRSMKAIDAWCSEHLGFIPQVTCKKDFGMVLLYDDRCRQVEQNTGRVIGDTPHL